MSIQFGGDGFDRLQDTNTALGSVAGASGMAYRTMFILGAGTAPASDSKILDDGSDSRLELTRLASSDNFQFRITTDNGSSLTNVGSGFAIPRDEWVDIYLRVTNGVQTVYMWRESTDTVTVVDSDTLAFAGTPSDSTAWRFGCTDSGVHNLKAYGFTMWKQANDATAVQNMLANRHSSARDLPTGISWNVPLNQTSGTVTDGDTGLADTSGNFYHFTVSGTIAPLWDPADPELDSDVLKNVTSITVPSAGTTATAVWDTGETLGTVNDTTDWTAKGYLSCGDDGRYDWLYADPAGADSIAEVSGEVTGTWPLGGRVLTGETLSLTVQERALWADDSVPAYRNAAQTALTAGTTNSSTQTLGNNLTRFMGAPIVASATPHNRPVASGSTPVNVMVMDEWSGVQAVRFSWFAADGTTPKSVPFTPHGGIASTATTHTMSASAWVQPLAYMGSAEYGEFWGGVLDVSGESDGTQIKWKFEVQDHWGVWHSACSDGTAWPQKSILVHTDPLIIHLSNSGNDTTGDGSIGNPYATLQASALVTAIRGATKPVEVHHAAGTYTIGTADFRPGGTGTAHAHLITLRPADGLGASDVTYNNVGLSSSALRRGNFNLSNITFDMSSTIYGWVTTGSDEDDERCCQEGVVYTDGGAAKGVGERGLGIDGDDLWAVSVVQTGKFRGFAINSFDDGSGDRAVRDVIVWDYEMTNSGTFIQGVTDGGLFGRCYCHGNAQDATYPGDQHFDWLHFTTPISTVSLRRTIMYANIAEDNGDPIGGDSGYAYNMVLVNCDQVDFGVAFNIRNDADDQPGIQLESETNNVQVAFNVERSSVAMIRNDAVADDEVGRRFLLQNNLVGTVGSFRDKLDGMPERVMGGNVILDDGSYNDEAELDGSLLAPGSDPVDWGLTDFAGKDYTPLADGNAATVTTRPTNFRFDLSGNSINQASPAFAGAYAGEAESLPGDSPDDPRQPGIHRPLRANRGREERVRA
ncbi:MAG: hypothetical protein NCW75_05705 [Phycisphaera sp.]|nr:MAG: hypothetical protein NCW75_05705 [Phycisphaera sp.]